MAIEAEALRALSEMCPAPVKAVGRSLVVQQSEHRRFESYLGSPEMAQFLEALVNDFRDGSLIHRSALAEDTARAAEGQIPEGWKLVPVEPTDDMMIAALELDDMSIDGRYRAMLAAAPALPLDKEAAR